MNPPPSGYRSSEFALAVLVALCITGLVACGRIDPSSSLAMGAEACLYMVMRSAIKTKIIGKS